MPLCKENEKGLVYLALYINDNLMVGESEAVDEVIVILKENGLVLKELEGLQDSLSCKVKFLKDEKRAWLGEPHLIKNLDNKFVIVSKRCKVIKHLVCKKN